MLSKLKKDLNVNYSMRSQENKKIIKKKYKNDENLNFCFTGHQKAVGYINEGFILNDGFL